MLVALPIRLRHNLPLKLGKTKYSRNGGIRERIDRLLSQLESEIDILQVEKRIRGRR